MGNNVSRSDGCCGIATKLWNCNLTDYVKNPMLLKHLQDETGFTERQIQRLKARFDDLGGRVKGHLAPQDLLKIPIFRVNPIAPQIIIAIYKEELDPAATHVDIPDFFELRIRFDSFVKAFARFRPMECDHRSESKLNSYEGKCLFLFRILDINEDKILRFSEISDLLKSLTPFETDANINSFTEDLIMEMKEELKIEGNTISFNDFIRSETVRLIVKNLYFNITS